MHGPRAFCAVEGAGWMKGPAFHGADGAIILLLPAHYPEAVAHGTKHPHWEQRLLHPGAGRNGLAGLQSKQFVAVCGAGEDGGGLCQPGWRGFSSSVPFRALAMVTSPLRRQQRGTEEAGSIISQPAPGSWVLHPISLAYTASRGRYPAWRHRSGPTGHRNGGRSLWGRPAGGPTL